MYGLCVSTFFQSHDSARPHTIHDDGMNSTTSSSRMVCVSVTFFSEHIYSAMQSLGALAGVDIRFSRSEHSAFPAVITFEEVMGADKKVSVTFHHSYASYFPHPQTTYDVERQAGEILELLIAAGATDRGKIIGVVASVGGAGATTIASAMSFDIAEKHSLALVDCDSLSKGLDDWCEIDENGLRWADISEETGSLVPGRLMSVLPTSKNMRVLTGDARGGVDTRSDLAIRAVSALSQTHEVTIVDMPRHFLIEDNPLVSWCDEIIIVMNPSPRSIFATQELLKRIPEHIERHVVANKVSSISHGAVVAEVGVRDTHPVRFARGLERDLNHGLSLRDRVRSGMRKDIARFSARYSKDEAGA